MKRFLLTGLAAGALAIAAPAWAQNIDPFPAMPPVEQPEATPEVTADETLGVGVEEEPLQAAPPPGEILAQPAPDAQMAIQPPAASPADQNMAQEAPGGTLDAAAQGVCQPRVTSVHFGRGAALSLENRNAIEYAVDAASVCNLEQVVITDSAQGPTSDRRTETVRAALIERGVPADDIIVAEQVSAEGAATGQLDVRMTFAGVATAQTPVARLEGAHEPTGD